MPTADALIARARSALLHPAMYYPGLGGHDPTSPSPQGRDLIDLGQHIHDPRVARYRQIARELGFDPDTLGPQPGCDCSGFIWWVLREPRANRDTRWIHADALGQQTCFRVVSRSAEFIAQPGDLLVYAAPPGAEFGHVALVTEVADRSQPSPATRIIHCAGEHMRRPPAPGVSTPSCYAETDPEVFRAHHDNSQPGWSALVCRPWHVLASA